MRKTLYTLLCLCAVFMSSSCSEYVDDAPREYIPDAVDGEWNFTPGDDDDSGDPDIDPDNTDIDPQDPSLAGTMASAFKGMYDGTITVAINGNEAEPTQQTVRITAVNGKYINFYLNNFMLTSKDEETGEVDVLPVGNIELHNIKLVPCEDGENDLTFTFNQAIFIQPGDDQEQPWLGPLLPEIPITLNGILSGEDMLIEINIDMTDLLGQIIEVGFTTVMEE